MGCLFSATWCCCEAACCVTCCGLETLCNCTVGRCARIGHILLIASTYLVAIIVGTYYTDLVQDLPGVELDYDCSGGYYESCHLNQMVYRASASLVVVFAVIAAGSYGYAPMHSGLWTAKYLSVFILWFASFFLYNKGFDIYTNWARILSFGWLSIQSLLVIELGMQANDAFADSGGSTAAKVTFFGMCSVFFGFSIWGIIELYSKYAGCFTGAFFVGFTVAMNVVTTSISVLRHVEVGLLPSMVLFTYTTFLCWYALLSCEEESCNPTADESYLDSSDKLTSLYLVMTITCAAVGYMLWQGQSMMSTLFGDGPAGHGAQAEDESKKLDSILAGESQPLASQPTADNGSIDKAGEAVSAGLGEPREEVVFFHGTMLALCIYLVMAITSWARVDGAPEADGTDWEPRVSLWVKIMAQWTTFGFYLLVCRANYNANCEPEDKIAFPFCWFPDED